MYVGTFTGVNVYDPGTGKLLRTITDGVDIVVGEGMDRDGTLYVANGAGGPHGQGTVQEYARGTGKLLRVIHDGLDGPWAFAFDSKNDLYVANQYGAVTEYAPGGTTVIRTISDNVSYPVSLAVDGSDDLFVGNSSKRGSVTEYAPGSTTAMRTITRGVDTPLAIGVDTAGDVFAANYRGGTVTEYAPGAMVPAKTLGSKINGLESMFVDKASGSIYVGNYPGLIRRYDATGKQTLLIDTGIRDVHALGLASSGDIVAVDYGNASSQIGAVTVYDPSTGKRTMKIVQNIHYPTSVVFGPP